MDLLAVFILAAVIAAAMIAVVITWASNRASSAAITSYFKAGEYIIETGQAPPGWHAQPKWKRLFGKSPNQVNTADCLKRLDDLIRFFQHCSFFQDERAREELLSQLGRVREAWMNDRLN